MSPATTGSSELTGILAGLTGPELEVFRPANAAEADDAIGSVAQFCSDYCPARTACVEHACRLFRLESRSDVVRRATPQARVGVQDKPIIGL